ncbi:hypothetical protein RMATCC62417_10812 [Rhizopus microsporus]|nr:hypothetical protein RMATCC62417_10812 [Rhizopus microsporus]
MGKPTILTLGECIKEMDLRVKRSMSFEEFEQLVTYCPNVESIHVSTWLYRNCISTYLLEIGDDIKWSLRRIIANDPNNPYLELYLKYKDSIVSMNAPSDVKDLQFLASFPSLQTFRLHRYRIIKSMQEFMFIFDTCPKLTYVRIQAITEDASCLITNQDIYPSLTSLKMETTFSSVTRSMVDYISTRFINLSSVTLDINQTDSPSFEENYIRLVNALMTPYKRRFSFTLALTDCYRSDDENAQMKFTRMLAKCVIEAFKLKPRAFNLIEVTKVERKPGIRICVDKELHCMLFTWAPFSYLLKQDALSGGAISRHLHKLKMKSSRLTMDLSRDDCLSIGACTQIQELAFHYVVFRSIQNWHHNSLQILSLPVVFVDSSFFPTLGRVFPKLKILKLGVGSIKVDGNEGVIDMQGLKLQKLNLAIRPRGYSGTTWLIVVKTHKEYVYIKIHKCRKFKVLTYEKAMEQERRTQFNERYHIYCCDIQELALYDKKITLHPNSTISDTA